VIEMCGCPIIDAEEHMLIEEESGVSEQFIGDLHP
jgi:hypothetical protein